MDVTAHATRRYGNPRRNPLFRVIAAIILIAMLGFAYASPYIALDRLKRAANARDAETVNRYVDFPSLRESIKQQITGLLARHLDGGHDNPLAAIGAMIGTALIGPVVNAYTTPDGVAALLNGIPPSGDPVEPPPLATVSKAPSMSGTEAVPSPSSPDAVSPESTGNAPPQPPQTIAGYRDINEFVVTYQHGIGNARYSAIFRRKGLFSWKLAAVDLDD
jgi:cbb3-type cytochrome oxidase subunit 3